MVGGVLGWGFRANVQVHMADDKHSKELTTKDGSRLTLNELVHHLDVVDPSKKLWLNPLLFNGTLQTLYYAKLDALQKYQIYYGREVFHYKDEGICSLDWVIPPPESTEQFKQQYKETLPEGLPRLHPRSRYFSEDEIKARTQENQADITTPLVVILHGLGGGSHEPLIRNLAENIANKTNNTWDCVVINNRGCCRTKVTNGKLFNALSVDDIGEVVEALRARYPNRPLYAVGFSFGACMLANYLGTLPDNSLVHAAALVGCPWDLVDLAYHIQNSLTGRHLLNPALTTFLNKIVKNNFAELNKHSPYLFSEENLKLGMQQKRTWQFDSVYTCHTAGYASPWEYYREASPARRISKINIPTIALNSTDDPAVSVRLPSEEIAHNPNMVMVETDLGGHLGWVQLDGKFWCVEVVEEFFTLFDEKVK